MTNSEQCITQSTNRSFFTTQQVTMSKKTVANAECLAVIFALNKFRTYFNDLSDEGTNNGIEITKEKRVASDTKRRNRLSGNIGQVIAPNTNMTRNPAELDQKTRRRQQTEQTTSSTDHRMLPTHRRTQGLKRALKKST
ncbi:hypothetical protein JGG76_24260 [Salmonella enterica subsp. enterica serovar Derby]|nr:hypothetical protein [Salmonella enterica subsp. enterica serovar Derby]